MSTIEITGRKSFQIITRRDLKELLDYRDLLYMLVVREIKVLYKQTIIGLGWVVLKPLLQMILFTVIFGRLAGIEKLVQGDVPYALFTYAALVPWSYFSAAVANSASSLITSADFVTKIYFPRVIIPLVPVIAKLLDFIFAFVLLIALMIYYGIAPSVNILYLPMLVLLMFFFAFACGLWLSALAIQYRDINQAVQFLIQVLMFASPIIWPIAFIPEKYRLIYGFYPMAGVIEGFRSAMTGTSPMPWDLIAMASMTTFVLFVTGVIFYRNREKVFADVV
ncbi:MAG TPA: ABC transporter permease [Chitinophagales bacterium]|nr:ABC transporter permease [Chitinophagales bacterium]